MRIRMGDNFSTSTKGKCNQVNMEIGKVNVSIEVFLFELRDLDIILGMVWLQTSGYHRELY